MTRIIYTERFLQDMGQVELQSKQNEIYDCIDLLLSVPSLGSNRLPRAIREEFGDTVRKMSVAPFLVIYEYMDNGDLILVHGLVHQRKAF